MLDHPLARAGVACGRCGYLTRASGGAVNFCPKCGADLRGAPSLTEPVFRTPKSEPAPAEPSPPAREPATPPRDARTYTSVWSAQGQIIAERYRLIELLGEGGMGAVFKAEHVRMGKALAVKLLRGDFARDPSAVARFRAEAQIVSRLSHPHTIAVFDFGDIGEEGFYLAMEYVPGRNLATLLTEHGKLSVERAAGIAEQMLGSLAEAHEAGVVHRDVKPANVMVVEAREGDFVKVLDFGIAKLRGHRGVETTGAVLGTPSYLAPEQALGEEVDGRADLYAVGAILYELLAGRPPFVAAGPVEVVAAQLREAPTPLRELAPDVSPRVEEVVHRALAKLPGDRFESAHAMRDALLTAVGRAGSRRLTAARPAAAPASAAVRGGPPSLEIARRADFAELERGRSALGWSRTASLALGLGGLLVASCLVAAWRWADVYPILARRAPRVAASLSPSLRPDGFFDGEEHEPNDTPALANAVLLPSKPGETAMVRGHVGARLDAITGDVDVFRVVVPDAGRRQVLVAEWSADGRPGEGIRGLDVKLTLNRDQGGADRRRSAPLVTQVDRGGPGEGERLAALVAPGTYYLAIREKHSGGGAPVERPADAYLVKVWLEEPRPGEELEPNDEPEPAPGPLRYARWRALAERNALREGDRVRGDTSEDDPDTFAVAPRGALERPDLALLVPEPGLALTVQLWLPDAEDLAPVGAERIRFAEAGEGEPGEVVAVKLLAPAAAGAPALLRLRAASGRGRYQVLAVGAAPGGARAVLSLLGTAGPENGTGALEAAAVFARMLPAAAGRDEALLAAGHLAAKLAPALGSEALGNLERTAKSLGRPPFEVVNGKVRYGGAFELLVAGTGPVAEEARRRAVAFALPCTSGEVAARARAFLVRFPRSAHAREVRLALARAEEDAFLETGRHGALLRAIEAYRALAPSHGSAADEARDRLRLLLHQRPELPALPRTRCE